MLATLARSSPSMVRAARSTGLPSRVAAVASARRPLAIRAYKDEPAKSEADAAKPVATRDQSQVARPAPAMMRLPSLFAEMQREMDELSRFFDDSFFDISPMMRSPRLRHVDAALPSAGSMLRLAADVHETDDAWTITADVPGMSKDKVKVQVQDGTLTITGERSEEHKHEVEGKPLRYERSFGSFARSFGLPPNCDADAIRAAVKEGVLTVTLPKKEVEAPKAKDIPVA